VLRMLPLLSPGLQQVICQKQYLNIALSFSVK
jgi:energy-converting hydrogenase Eha subunit C